MGTFRLTMPKMVLLALLLIYQVWGFYSNRGRRKFNSGQLITTREQLLIWSTPLPEVIIKSPLESDWNLPDSAVQEHSDGTFENNTKYFPSLGKEKHEGMSTGRNWMEIRSISATILILHFLKNLEHSLFSKIHFFGFYKTNTITKKTKQNKKLREINTGMAIFFLLPRKNIKMYHQHLLSLSFYKKRASVNSRVGRM